MASCLRELTNSEWVELQDAAKIIGCSVSGLRKLVKRNAIRFAQAGRHGRIRFRREWLNEIIEPETVLIRARKRKEVRPVIEARFGFDPALLDL